MKLLIGLPTLGDIPPSVAVSLMRVATEARRLGEVYLSHTEGLIPHDKGREAIFKDAKEADVDYVLCVDSDMIFPEDTVGRLYRALVDSDAQVASGMYVRRGHPYTSVWSKWAGGEWHQVSATEGIHEIDMTGLGCALIDFRWLRENLSPPYCRYERRYDRVDVLDDESLFVDVKAKGGKIVGVGEVQCGHLLRPEVVTVANADQFRGLKVATLF